MIVCVINRTGGIYKYDKYCYTHRSNYYIAVSHVGIDKSLSWRCVMLKDWVYHTIATSLISVISVAVGYVSPMQINGTAAMFVALLALSISIRNSTTKV